MVLSDGRSAKEGQARGGACLATPDRL